VDQYELAAPLYDGSADDLRIRDESQATPARRWLALRNGVAAGAVMAGERPDDKLFLSFVGSDESTYGPLGMAAARAFSRPVRTTVDADARGAITALRGAGFVTELTSERFRIRFDSALAGLRRAWVPNGYSVVTAEAVDIDRLFALDNTLRHDVPGTDGWHGDRAWFRGELTEAPPLDPTAYLVGTHDATDELVALVRIWRNPSGPRLGLIGVVAKHRSTVIAAALLKQALTAASSWGHDTFVTETSLTNRVIYPRLDRLGAESLGQSLQMVHRT